MKKDEARGEEWESGSGLYATVILELNATCYSSWHLYLLFLHQAGTSDQIRAIKGQPHMGSVCLQGHEGVQIVYIRSD